MEDPYYIQIATSDLAELARALEILDEHSDLNHRYRKMLDESRQMLTADEVRLTQARGLAKRLMVLLKAAGEEFPDSLSEDLRTALDAARERADSLVFHPEEG